MVQPRCAVRRTQERDLLASESSVLTPLKRKSRRVNTERSSLQIDAANEAFGTKYTHHLQHSKNEEYVSGL